jgi:hypothetical protein
LQRIQKNILIAYHPAILHIAVNIAFQLKAIAKIQFAGAFKDQLY